MRFALGFAVGLLLMTAFPVLPMAGGPEAPSASPPTPPYPAPQPTTTPTPPPTPPPPMPPSWPYPQPVLPGEELRLDCVVKRDAPIPPEPQRGSWHVASLHFDRAAAPWFALRSQGCGFCPPPQGFQSAAQNRMVVVFANLRVIAIDWNPGQGSPQIHRAPGHSDAAPVTYDAEELAQFLRGEAYVHRVWTGVLQGPGAGAVLDDLARAWVHPTRQLPPPTDTAPAHYELAQPSGEPLVENIYSLPEGETFERVAGLLARIDGELRGHGLLQGEGPPMVGV